MNDFNKKEIKFTITEELYDKFYVTCNLLNVNPNRWISLAMYNFLKTSVRKIEKDKKEIAFKNLNDVLNYLNKKHSTDE